MNNKFVEELFKKLTNDTDEAGEDIISIDGGSIVNGEDLIDYFKNTLRSNLEWDTGHFLNEEEMYNVLLSTLTSMSENKTIMDIAQSDATDFDTLSKFSHAYTAKYALEGLTDKEKYSKEQLSTIVGLGTELWKKDDGDIDEEYFQNWVVELVNSGEYTVEQLEKMPFSKIRDMFNRYYF